MRTTSGHPVKIASFVVIAFLSVAIFSCKSKPNQPAARQTKTQTSEAPLPPPALDDVRAKVESIYHGALIVDSRRKPVFLLGDFNADKSEDVLVAVRPNPKRLTDLNSELAAWILEDPREIWVPDPGKVVQVLPPKPRLIRVRAGDRPWVIIHGFREKGWRNPLATQSYLLVNVGKRGWRREPAREASAELKQVPLPIGIQYLLRYNGDVLRETIAGEPRLLYWTGGHYAWTAPL
ncbi:MAG TPA: hypothetical protein VGK01_00730 [Candidatus Angelobacter sp.]|jgi:hypothetical protein